METKKKTVVNRGKRPLAAKAPVSRALYEFRSFEMIKTAINHYGYVLSLGYSEKNWEQAESIRRSISRQVDNHVHRALGVMMTSAFTDTSYDALTAAKSSILIYLNEQVERSVG